MIDEGYAKSPPPIKLTKIHPEKIEVPRDNFVFNLDLIDSIPKDCMRYVKANGKSYAVTYWNCPVAEKMGINPDGVCQVVYECSKCEVVTWIEVENE